MLRPVESMANGQCEITVPVPEVFAFDATLDHELKCPFILMRFIPGMFLYNCWFDRGIHTIYIRYEKAGRVRSHWPYLAAIQLLFPLRGVLSKNRGMRRVES